MRAFVWLMVVALTLLAVTSYVVCELVLRDLREIQPDLPLPYISRMVLLRDAVFLYSPIPWAIWAAVLTFRRRVEIQGLLVFAGAAVVGMAVLFCVTAIAALEPYAHLVNV